MLNGNRRGCCDWCTEAGAVCGGEGGRPSVWACRQEPGLPGRRGLPGLGGLLVRRVAQMASIFSGRAISAWIACSLHLLDRSRS